MHFILNFAKSNYENVKTSLSITSMNIPDLLFIQNGIHKLFLYFTKKVS
jgi:hypothetical protein